MATFSMAHDGITGEILFWIRTRILSMYSVLQIRAINSSQWSVMLWLGPMKTTVCIDSKAEIERNRKNAKTKINRHEECSIVQCQQTRLFSIEMRSKHQHTKMCVWCLFSFTFTGARRTTRITYWIRHRSKTERAITRIFFLEHAHSRQRNNN